MKRIPLLHDDRDPDYRAELWKNWELRRVQRCWFAEEGFDYFAFLLKTKHDNIASPPTPKESKPMRQVPNPLPEVLPPGTKGIPGYGISDMTGWVFRSAVPDRTVDGYYPSPQAANELVGGKVVGVVDWDSYYEALDKKWDQPSKPLETVSTEVGKSSNEPVASSASKTSLSTMYQDATIHIVFEDPYVAHRAKLEEDLGKCPPKELDDRVACEMRYQEKLRLQDLSPAARRKRQQALSQLSRPLPPAAHPRTWPDGSYDDVDELGSA